jgi:caspase domain-containing protein
MSLQEAPGAFYKGPAFALVIGISKYQYGQEPGQKLAPEQFPNLNLASKDAADFANHLMTNGFIEYGVTSLLDERAVLPTIHQKFDWLQQQCERSGAPNPLVIVYFAGHGMVDARDRHYLVPHDAKRDNLVGTALQSEQFKQRLDELKTNRLVVFVDACHSGGIGRAGVRGGLSKFDAVKALGAGAGRYVIASCRSDQESFELKNNGIFTSHLLELLKCEADDFGDVEEIDIFDLYPKLKHKVKATALREFGKDQEPIADMTEATGIVLAINQQAIKRRCDQDMRAKKRAFAAVINQEIKKRKDYSRGNVLARWLSNYAEKDHTNPGFEELYDFFDVYFKDWDPGRTFAMLSVCCNDLIGNHRDIFDSLARQDATRSQEQAIDKFAGPAETKVLRGGTAAAVTLSGSQQPKRQLSDEDRAYILAEIGESSACRAELDRHLTQPLSEAEFVAAVRDMAAKANDDAAGKVLQGVERRFRERWPGAKAIELTTASGIMMARR